jgi:phospholipase/lecithinase/hemolysin
MHRLKLPLFLLCAGTLAAQVAPAPAADAHPYTMLYVFGDSYSDSGAGYVDANGPTAVVYLARRLGIPFTYNGDPDSAGKGLNFAVSAASSGEGAGRRLPTGAMLAFGMKNQIEAFVQYSKSGTIPKIDPANTMFFFAGGLNDGGRPEGFTRTNIESEIETLYGLGARRFMVAILPTKIPQFARAGKRVNPELEKIPGEMRAAHPDIRIALSQWGSFFDEVITNPAKYGLTDTTNQCADRDFGPQRGGGPCASPDTYFFYHEGHPSTAAHRAVGDMLYREAIGKLP